MRRKDPRNLPSLPLSAFTPPNTGTSEQFPVPGSPSTLQPESVVDGHVIAAGGNLSEWKKETGQFIGGRIGGVVLSLQGQPADVESALAELESSKESAIIAVVVPFSLEAAPPAMPPSSTYPISFSTVYTKSVPEPALGLKWALEQGRAVDLDVQCDITENDAQWESFEDMLVKAMADSSKATPLVLSNVLPPPADITLSMVKLMNHPSYRAYQSHTAALSLFPNLYVKFLPPAWNAPTPSAGSSEGSKETHEWKRRIKMYLGPVLEAFGFQRIIFGTSPSITSIPASHAGDWCEIARECLAELNVEQEAIDGVFSDNAKKVYGSSP